MSRRVVLLGRVEEKDAQPACEAVQESPAEVSQWLISLIQADLPA